MSERTPPPRPGPVPPVSAHPRRVAPMLAGAVAVVLTVAVIAVVLRSAPTEEAVPTSPSSTLATTSFGDPPAGSLDGDRVPATADEGGSEGGGASTSPPVPVDDGDAGAGAGGEVDVSAAEPPRPIFELYADGPLLPDVRAALDEAALVWDRTFTDGFAPAAYDGRVVRRVLVSVRVGGDGAPSADGAAARIEQFRDDGRALAASIRLGSSFGDERAFAAKDRPAVVNLFVHELGHVLLDPVFRDHGARWCTTQGWTSPTAVAAHRDAGGSGDAVPVVARTGCAHWDLSGEIMHPTPGRFSALSAITLGVLVDGGYPVDLATADAYQVPGGEFPFP